MIAVADQLAVRQWLTPPQIARERGIRTGKVLAWIAAGQLVAVNHATRLGGRPRWRISRAALNAFDAARSSRMQTHPKTATRRRERDSTLISFF